MDVEELRTIAKSMGYNIIKIKPYEKFLPCVCGCNRREHWSGVNDNDAVIYICSKCGRRASGKNVSEAKHNWNIEVKKWM